MTSPRAPLSRRTSTRCVGRVARTDPRWRVQGPGRPIRRAGSRPLHSASGRRRPLRADRLQSTEPDGAGRVATHSAGDASVLRSLAGTGRSTRARFDQPVPPGAATCDQLAALPPGVRGGSRLRREGQAPRNEIQEETALFFSDIAIGPIQAALRDLAMRRGSTSATEHASSRRWT